MTSRDITAVVLRLFSLWLLVQVILNVPALVMLLTSIEQYQGRVIPEYVHVLLVGGLVLLGLFAALLIWFAAGSALARCSGEGGEALDQEGRMFLLQLGGVYFMVTALADLPQSLGFLSYSSEFSYTDWLWTLGLVVQLCIGLSLAVAASQWKVLLATLRGRR